MSRVLKVAGTKSRESLDPALSRMGSYKITHASQSVSPLVTPFFSKTGHEIILIFGMKLYVDNRKNGTEPNFG